MVRKGLSAIVALVMATGLVAFTAAPASASVTTPVYEWNTAVAGTPPSFTKCTSSTYIGSGDVQAIACYVEGSDDFWVKDTKVDGYSAAADWILAVPNGISMEIVRRGICINSLGGGKWGVCKKNFDEAGTLGWFAGTYDKPTDTWHHITSNVSTRA
ncbi:MAG: hypothetical protein HKP61_19765 [Dactylosporangium sp.]|nr:hypothetical protein [Dactylosporangium sp.]NNJ63125.1 hypothetical protein [Dactylosporangium sp.]